VPRSVPFHVFLAYFMFIISSVSIIAVFLVTQKLTNNNLLACVTSAVFYLTAFPAYARTVVGGFVEEDFALPFIFLSFFFFLKAVERSNKKILYSVLSAVCLFIPLTSWHLTQFYFILFLVFVLLEFFLRYEEREQMMLPFLIITGVNLLAGLIITTLRAEGFALSYVMLASYSLILTWFFFKGTMGNKWLSAAVFALVTGFLVGGIALLTSKHGAEYSHVYSLVKYKLLYLGAKPDDPSSMTFDAKVFWQAGFLTPPLKNIAVAFAGLLLASIFGLWKTGVKVYKRLSNMTEDGAIFFLLAFIPLYLFFERLYVFLAFFMAPFAGCSSPMSSNG